VQCHYTHADYHDDDDDDDDDDAYLQVLAVLRAALGVLGHKLPRAVQEGAVASLWHGNDIDCFADLQVLGVLRAVLGVLGHMPTCMALMLWLNDQHYDDYAIMPICRCLLCCVLCWECWATTAPSSPKRCSTSWSACWCQVQQTWPWTWHRPGRQQQTRHSYDTSYSW
jgi:hypothetical protein